MDRFLYCPPIRMYTLKSFLSGICLLVSLALAAQKRDSVSDLPFSNKTEVSIQVLDYLFQAKGKIAIDLSPGFHIEGNIQNKSSHGDEVVSLLIKLDNRKGSLLSLTKTRDKNGNIFYKGSLLKLHD